MDDMHTFEREIAGVIQRAIGPARPVDAMAVARAASTQSPKWRFQSMFSATKFVVAGVIVALFGGFLLTGVLTQQPSDDRLPAVGASASATTQAEPTEAATTESEPTTKADADDTASTPDLLPGVDLVTEEVEPGVYRVLSDGIRDIAGASQIHVGLDESVVVARTPDSPCRGPQCAGYRLGDPDTFSLAHERLTFRISDVGPDGTIWGYSFRQGDGRRDLRSWDGKRWVGRWQRTPSRHMTSTVIGGSRDVWATWEQVDPDRGKVVARRFGRLAGDKWEVLRDEWGVRWLTSNADGSLVLLRIGDTIQRVTADGLEEFRDFTEPPIAGSFPVAGVGDDGTLWWATWSRTGDEVDRLARLDGAGWSTYEVPPHLPPWHEIVVAPDGAVWWGATFYAPEEVDGLVRFDGEAWTQFVRGTGVSPSGTSIDFAPDGTVWALLGDGASAAPYVITPEAVAGTE